MSLSEVLAVYSVIFLARAADPGVARWVAYICLAATAVAALIERAAQ